MQFSLFRYDFILLLFLFLCFFPRACFPARITPGHITVTTTDDTHTHRAAWFNFTRFKDAENGSHVISGMSELKKYFQRFGYLSVRNESFTGAYDTQFESAVILYQRKLGLPVTGKFDFDTTSTIIAPRCCVSDSSPAKIHATKHFAYFNGMPRWNNDSASTTTTMTLTAFSPSNMINYITLPEIRTVFKRSFSRWASVIPINFTEVQEHEEADITIGFYGGDHGDGALGVLAHSFAPENGRIHFDEDETWAVDFKKAKSKSAVDLESVATHEIGHILGLGHSSVQDAVMYPSLSPLRRRRELKLDDVEGVQALYGSNPNFEISSLLEFDNVSNKGTGLVCRSSNWTLSLVVLLFFILLVIV